MFPLRPPAPPPISTAASTPSNSHSSSSSTSTTTSSTSCNTSSPISQSATSSSFTNSSSCGSGNATVTVGNTPIPRFSFNESEALTFYSNISTSLGLVTTFPNSHEIYLSDDQALDYYSLLQIYHDTSNTDATDLAQKINNTMAQYGGLFQYWNPVFEILGNYGPFGNSPANGSDITYGTNGSYTIKYTNFSANPNFNYSQYSDALAYRVLLDIHHQNYSLAETDFTKSYRNVEWMRFR